MRIAKVIFAGSVAGAIALATPALARHSDAQKPAEETASSSACHAYEMGPDGVWRQATALPGSRRARAEPTEIRSA
jgi:hypothetical protein